jgi:twitching motility protein PilT
MITDPEQTGRLREVIAEGEFYGMQTFDQALLRHYQADRVSLEDALRVSTSPHDFKLLVAGDGRTATSMDDIVSDQKSPLRPVQVSTGGASENGDGAPDEAPPREYAGPPGGPGRAETSTPPPFAA